MPLKVAALDLGVVDDVARKAGAGNTLILEKAAPGLQHRRRRPGVGGAPGILGQLRRVTILGSGATARSALLSAVELGAREVTVLARTPGKAGPLEALAPEHGIRLEYVPGRWTR